MKVVAVLGGLGSQMMKFAFYLKLKKLMPDEDIYIDSTFFLQNQCWNGFELERIFSIHEKDFIECYTEAEKSEIIDKKLSEKKYYEYVLDKMISQYGKGNFYYIIRGRKVLYFCSNKIYKKLYNAFSKVHEKFYALYNIYFNPLYESYCAVGIGNYLDRYTKAYSVRKENIYYDEFNHVSDKYFSGMKKELQKVFAFPDFNEMENTKIKVEMEKSDSVAVHIRMTDHMYDNGELMKRDYYKKAVTYLRSRVARPVFFVFADDYKWCRENIELLGFNEEDSIKFITWNRGRDSYKDMQLMTYCKHNILAISSFSWWGYYLSRYEKKIVCAPKGYWLEVKNHF